MVARIAIPLTLHIAAACEAMGARTRLLQAYPGCLWGTDNPRSDRGDFPFSCSGWESRLAWGTANQDLDLPNLWTDLTGMFNAVSLDLLEPILELVPDRLAMQA